MAPPVSRSLRNAAPFAISLLLLPLVWLGATRGGWLILTLPIATSLVFALLDRIGGLNAENPGTEARLSDLFWYRALTMAWVPLQFGMIFGTLWYVSRTDHLSGLEQWGLFLGIGVVSGAVGIVYAHELMHQKPRHERLLGDLLLGMVLYGHFRSEHLLVHHVYVGTPRDPVTARYNESFYRFFPRILVGCLKSSFRAEKAMLARKGLGWWHPGNPFWRYWALEAMFCALALAIGGWWGLLLFATQAFYAIWYLELVNYIEHYGLTRKHLGGGKYEHVRPRHSWNASHRVSNWLLINLQRHSDHHYKPDRRFPLLQTYTEDEAPQLPRGYPLMTVVAMIPPLWRRMMNPRVRQWRRQFYPEITDWSAYKSATTPIPR